MASSSSVQETSSITSSKENSRNMNGWKSPTKARLETTPGFKSATSPSIRSQIKLLEKTRADLEDAGKYLEAQEIHEQLSRLKLSAEARRRDSIRANKQTQLRTLEELYEDDMQAIRDHYEQELREFERRVENGLSEMQARHERCLAAYKSRVVASVEELEQVRFPPSKQLLEMRRTEKALARQHEYKDAHDLKNAADAMERKEMAERMDKLRQSNSQGEERLKERLRNELSVFEQRNTAIRNMILENRKQEEVTALHRYQNKKNEMFTASSRVEVLIDRRMEQLSPARQVNRKKPSQLNSSLVVEQE
jgi:hypothetical protein